MNADAAAAVGVRSAAGVRSSDQVKRVFCLALNCHRRVGRSAEPDEDEFQSFLGRLRHRAEENGDEAMLEYLTANEPDLTIERLEDFLLEHDPGHFIPALVAGLLPEQAREGSEATVASTTDRMEPPYGTVHILRYAGREDAERS